MYVWAYDIRVVLFLRGKYESIRCMQVGIAGRIEESTHAVAWTGGKRKGVRSLFPLFGETVLSDNGVTKIIQ
jgi:hypothetical protein